MSKQLLIENGIRMNINYIYIYNSLDQPLTEVTGTDNSHVMPSVWNLSYTIGTCAVEKWGCLDGQKISLSLTYLP